MRSRKAANDQVAEVARRRIELLSAELAGGRREVPQPQHLVQAEAVSRAPTLGAPPDSADGSPDPSTGISVHRPTGTSAVRPGRHAQRPVGMTSRIGGWLHDRLPPTLQGSVGLTSAHLTLVALLVAAALAVTAWWVVRAEPDSGSVVPTVAKPVSTPSRPPLSAVPAAEPAPASPSAGGGTPIIVDVAGKVRRPGIASLPVGSRVVDALKAAGGPRRGVDLTPLNLARVLVDGEQIVVGIAPPAGVAAPAASAPGAAGTPGAGALVNINTASQSELETLPGIGPVTAESILAWRTENGAFTAVDELLEVSGIGDVTLAEIAPFVTI